MSEKKKPGEGSSARSVDGSFTKEKRSNTGNGASETGKNSNSSEGGVTVDIACVTQEGHYHENEDRMAFGVNLNDSIDGYVGVFDGHGGEECADYVSTNLSHYLSDYFENDADWAAGDEKMKEMFHQIEADYIELAVEERDTSGACATVAIVRGLDVLIANIGDCKGLAMPDVNDDSYHVLTGDHRADAEEELERINKAGGSVFEGRIMNLQPSRSFGDIDVKEVVGDGVVIPTPEVSRVAMQPGGFMIVATDGLWDVVGDDDVISMAKDCLEKNNYDGEYLAKELLEIATDLNSTDDITVSVLIWQQN